MRKDRPRFLSTALDLLSFLESQEYLVSLFSLSSLLNHHRSVFFNVRWIVEIVLIKEQQHSEYVCFRREYQTIEFAFEFEFELDFELDFELKIELDIS